MKDRGVETLLSIARAWSVSKPLRSKFAQRGYTGYLDKLTEVVAQVSKAVEDKTVGSSARIQNFAAIKQLYSRTRKTFRRLDALLSLELRSDPTVLAVWPSASRIDRPPSTKPAAGTTNPSGGSDATTNQPAQPAPQDGWAPTRR